MLKPHSHIFDPILSVQNLTKRFYGFTALDRVNLEVRTGEIVALLGENGAGKSTLVKILAGIHRSDSGEIYFKKRKINPLELVEEKKHKAISFIHQDLGLVDWMSISENIALVIGYRKKNGLIDWQSTRKQASVILKEISVFLDPDKKVSELTFSEKSILAIVRAIAVNATILILDEPTASLPEKDVENVFKVLKKLKSDGMGMIYISHRLDEIHKICDRIVILRDGVVVGHGEVSDFSTKDMVKLIAGKEKRSYWRTPLKTKAPVICKVQEVMVEEVGPISFEVHSGELISLTGVRSAGQDHLGSILFGLRCCDAGKIFLNGKEFEPKSPREAIDAGIAMVPSDRIHEGICCSMNIKENLNLNPFLDDENNFFSFLSTEKEDCKTNKIVADYKIIPNNPTLKIETLSGGNQQKVVVARWINLKKPLLIMSNPTSGVDIGSKTEIYKIMYHVLQTGVAIILISNDFEEIVNVSNRVLVFNRGKITADLKDSAVNFANLLEKAKG